MSLPAMIWVLATLRTRVSPSNYSTVPLFWLFICAFPSLLSITMVFIQCLSCLRQSFVYVQCSLTLFVFPASLYSFSLLTSPCIPLSLSPPALLPLPIPSHQSNLLLSIPSFPIPLTLPSPSLYLNFNIMLLTPCLFTLFLTFSTLLLPSPLPLTL